MPSKSKKKTSAKAVPRKDPKLGKGSLSSKRSRVQKEPLHYLELSPSELDSILASDGKLPLSEAIGCCDSAIPKEFRTEQGFTSYEVIELRNQSLITKQQAQIMLGLEVSEAAPAPEIKDELAESFYRGFKIVPLVLFTVHSKSDDHPAVYATMVDAEKEPVTFASLEETQKEIDEMLDEPLDESSVEEVDDEDSDIHVEQI